MFPLPSISSLCCSQISLLENTLLDWQNRTLRNDYRHAQPLNGRVVESSFRAKFTQGKGSQQAGLRLSPGRGKKPMWKELSCKSLKLGMLEVTFPRSSSVPAQQVEMAHVPLCPLPTHLACNAAAVAVGCVPALCFDCNGVTHLPR